MVDWLRSLLTGRTQVLRDGCIADIISILFGVPKAAIIGPILFILMRGGSVWYHCFLRPRLSFLCGWYAFHGTTVCNSLPSALRDSSLSLNTFLQRRLKTHLHDRKVVNAKPLCLRTFYFSALWCILYTLTTFRYPEWGRAPLSPIYFPIFSLFYFSLSFISFTYFLLLSIPSLSTRIVPLRFQAGGCRKRPNLGLVCCVLFVL